MLFAARKQKGTKFPGSVHARIRLKYVHLKNFHTNAHPFFLSRQAAYLFVLYRKIARASMDERAKKTHLFYSVRLSPQKNTATVPFPQWEAMMVPIS